MRSFVRLLFVVALALALALLAPLAMAHAAKEDLKVASLWGRGGFFSYRYRPYQAAVTCDRSIKVCRAKGSRGRNCCKKRCVDLKTDRYNCGKCGKKCKYSEICCKGKCVNPMFNRNNCGGCNNKCSRGSSCVYGMCGYA